MSSSGGIGGGAAAAARALAMVWAAKVGSIE
jgi:hypothetical protein